MEYLRVAVDTRKSGLREPAIRIYPLVCLHLGARECDIRFIKEHLRRIKDDPNAKMVYLGDGGECALKTSKGEVYKQTMGPQEQNDAVAELLEPFKDKLLCGFQGNHGRRVDNESGLSWDKVLCLRLGVPYLGVSAFVNLVVNRSSYDLYFHHGADSGTSLQSKVSKAEHFTKFVDADAIFTAHSHAALDLVPATIFASDNGAKNVKTKLRHQYICGSAYDSRSGYAEQKAYTPMLPSYISVEFDGRIIEGQAIKKQTCRIFRADGSYKTEDLWKVGI